MGADDFVCCFGVEIRLVPSHKFLELSAENWQLLLHVRCCRTLGELGFRTDGVVKLVQLRHVQLDQPAREHRSLHDIVLRESRQLGEQILAKSIIFALVDKGESNIFKGLAALSQNRRSFREFAL